MTVISQRWQTTWFLQWPNLLLGQGSRLQKRQKENKKESSRLPKLRKRNVVRIPMEKKQRRKGQRELQALQRVLRKDQHRNVSKLPETKKRTTQKYLTSNSQVEAVLPLRIYLAICWDNFVVTTCGKGTVTTQKIRPRDAAKQPKCTGEQTATPHQKMNFTV